MDSKSFYSNAKLMITGEYLALAGSLVLAVPLRFGQRMNVEPQPAAEPMISWEAREQGKVWYRGTFQGPGFAFDNPDDTVSDNLQRLLLQAHKMNPLFPDPAFSWKVDTDTNFPLEWGLGSSSTLISNLAWWAGVDPFELLFSTSIGSGYDIACARQNTPLLYRFNGAGHAPSVCEVAFEPPFRENLWFVYTGKKQSSAKSIEGINPAHFDNHTLERISELSMKMVKEENLDHFIRMMTAHETVIARAIDQLPLQAVRFTGFPGAIKSLGAWGGDFCMAASAENDETVRQYFHEKGCDIIFSFDEMILK
jgi:mevalonate kinase